MRIHGMMCFRQTILRCTFSLAVIGAMCVTLTSASNEARGDAFFPIARENVALKSDFTLDFGGVVTTGNITSTDMVLKLNPEQNSARVIQYFQKVEPLQIPIGPGIFLDTGDITVTVMHSIGGTFDGDTNAYGTEDIYAVYFEGDLSALGIESPFVLPSSSDGSLTFDAKPAGGAAGSTGQIDLEWNGSSKLEGPAGPIEFSYVCRVHTVFSITTAGDIDGDFDVDEDDFEFMQACYSGNLSYSDPHCELADLVRDKKINFADMVVFFENVTSGE